MLEMLQITMFMLYFAVSIIQIAPALYLYLFRPNIIYFYLNIFGLMNLMRSYPMMMHIYNNLLVFTYSFLLLNQCTEMNTLHPV